MNGFYSRFSNVYMTVPEISLPDEKVDNNEILRRIKANFSGVDKEFKKIERVLKKSFDYNGCSVRYWEKDGEQKIGSNAAKVAESLLQRVNVKPEELSMIICGSISRPYLEPCVAAEIAFRLGINSVHAFDVTCACSSLLQAAYTGATFLNDNQDIKYVLCCANELPFKVADYNVQSVEELRKKIASYTIGSASAAVLISKKPFINEGFKVNSFRSMTYPETWDACITPLADEMVTDSYKLFESCKKYLINEIVTHLKQLNWNIEDVSQIISHQTGDYFLQWLGSSIPGFDENKLLKEQHCYGNTAGVSVFLALHDYVRSNRSKTGDKILLVVPAGGMTMVTAGISYEPEQK